MIDTITRLLYKLDDRQLKIVLAFIHALQKMD